MKDAYIVCDNCGTKCHANDVYCKTCSHPLAAFTEQAIEGIDNQELRQFIGKNSEDYIKKFKKKKGDWFLQINFAALLFGVTWFFYRKMYKVASLYTVGMLLLSMLLSIAVPTLFKEDVEAFYAAEKARADYIDSGGETHVYKDPPYSNVMIGRHPTYQKLSDDLLNAERKLHLMEWLIGLTVLVADILMRLLANAFYKRHIRQNIGTEKGGTSVTGAVIGFVAVDALSTLCSFVVCLIPVVAQFQVAVSKWYDFWL